MFFFEPVKAQQLSQKIDVTLYRNHWIAIVRDRVVGVGETPEQAHRAAKALRPKDKPHLFFVDSQGNVSHFEMEPVENKRWLESQPLLQEVIQILQQHQIEAYLVGGAVRDLLLGREAIVDLDFAVPDDGLAVARQVANEVGAAFYPLDPERGTGRVVYTPAMDQVDQKKYLDFATFRGPTLRADLADRDFTINAIALRLAGPAELIDPMEGRQDLATKRIRATSADAFARDPVRVLRAVRQAVELGFSIEDETGHQLRRAASSLPAVSPERQRDELLKLVNTPRPGQAIQMLHQLEVLSRILPEIEAMVNVDQGAPHYLDLFNHTIGALEAWAAMLQAGLPDLSPKLQQETNQYLQTELVGNVTIRQLMPLALLWHDAGKPATRTEAGSHGRIRFLGHQEESANIARRAMTRFRFSNQAGGFVAEVVRHHMRPLLLAKEKKFSRRAVYRFFRDTGNKQFQAGVAVSLHALADHRATYPPGQGRLQAQALGRVVDKLLKTYFEQYHQMVEPPLLLSGRDLIENFSLKEGRLIGLLLKRLEEAQATGQVRNKTEALAFIEADPDFIDFQRKQRSNR